jgi:hypothetical protein
MMSSHLVLSGIDDAVMAGLLHRGEVTVDDLQDEVLSRAGQEADVIDRTGKQR